MKNLVKYTSPDKLAFERYKDLSLYELKESLVVLKWSIRFDKQFYEVWKMENDVSKSFTQLYNINKLDDLVTKLLGFRKNGELIMTTIDDCEESGELLVYEPDSKQINYVGVLGDCDLFFVSSYTESLLLLDQKEMLVIS